MKNLSQILTDRRAKQLSAAINIGFLAIHCVLFAVFSRYGVVPMARFNFFSIIFYILLFFLVQKNMLRMYVICTYAEVMLHMILATYYTGWRNDFQVTMIGMCALIFYAEYTGRVLGYRRLHAVPYCVLGLAGYLLVCVIDHSRPAPYPLPENISFIFQISWAVTVFVIDIFYLYMFVEIALDSEKKLEDEVVHDQLTGLPNRYYVSDYNAKLVDRDELEGHWVAVLDIDNFKKKNDTYGHNCGDFILQELARVLQSSCRQSTPEITVCRWGGEEFLLLGSTDPEHFTPKMRNARIDDLRRTVENHDFVYEGNTLHLTITIGIEDYANNIGTHEWIGNADQKLYYGKTHGKNQIVA